MIGVFHATERRFVERMITAAGLYISLNDGL